MWIGSNGCTGYMDPDEWRRLMDELDQLTREAKADNQRPIRSSDWGPWNSRPPISRVPDWQYRRGGRRYVPVYIRRVGGR